MKCSEMRGVEGSTGKYFIYAMSKTKRIQVGGKKAGNETSNISYGMTCHAIT